MAHPLLYPFDGWNRCGFESGFCAQDREFLLRVWFDKDQRTHQALYGAGTPVTCCTDGIL